MLKSECSDATKIALIKAWDQVLSLGLFNENKNVDVSFIEQKIAERQTAKKNKDYAKADEIRKELEEMGILLNDTREGTTYTVK